MNHENAIAMKTCLIRTAMAALGMFLCAVVGFFAPPLWEGVSGRDFRPQAMLTALLIVLLAVILRRGFHWRVADFIFGLLAAEFVTLCIIGHFTGYTWLQVFDPFNLQQLVYTNRIIGLPWFLGFGLGSLWLWLSERHAHTTT